MQLNEQISRMKQLSGINEAILTDTYYHGTSKEEVAQLILQQGVIKPGNRPGKSRLTPLMGRAYITKDIAYALIYALGGNMAGGEYPERYWGGSQYGYVFQVQPIDDTHVVPDEDEIGELIHYKKIPALNHLAQRYLTSRQMEKVMWGEYDVWAQAGKKLMKYLTPELKTLIMQQTNNRAHEGEMKIVHAWRVDKARCQEFDKKGSNFFEIAEQIL